MKIKTADFVKSSADYQQCPPTSQPELALIGRSNVGKSSLINMLLGHQNLAKISRKPGKTRLINHFLVNDAWYLVDLPGYGWAQVSKTQRQQWEKMVTRYLLYRASLRCVLVLVDARHPPQKLDLDLINWLGEQSISFVILLTKTDKVSKRQVQQHLTLLRRTLQSQWEVLPPILMTSSHDKTGREELLNYIQRNILN